MEQVSETELESLQKWGTETYESDVWSLQNKAEHLTVSYECPDLRNIIENEVLIVLEPADKVHSMGTGVSSIREFSSNCKLSK